jgi:NAD(P)-dependent dehydrogenase (short-subunit alcohol dehydrogenase family)
MINSEIQKYIVFGSTSSLSKALNHCVDCHFIGRGNPFNFDNFISHLGFDTEENINLSISILDNLVNKLEFNSLHLIFLQGISSNDWKLSINVNLLSVAMISEFISKKLNLIKSKGSLTYIGSAAGVLGGKMPYSATKTGLNGVMSSINKDFAPIQRANIVLPGAFEGKMTRDWDNEKQNRILKNTYSKRLASPEEIAESILFCTRNEYLCGNTINLTNGQIKE